MKKFTILAALLVIAACDNVEPQTMMCHDYRRVVAQTAVYGTQYTNPKVMFLCVHYEEKLNFDREKNQYITR